MGIRCLCDKYHRLKIKGTSKINAQLSGLQTFKQKICAEAAIKSVASKNHKTETRVCGSGKVRASNNVEFGPKRFICINNGKVRAKTTFPFSSVRSRLKSISKLTNKYVDKFGGHITAINDLQTSNKAEQKLYPSGDVSSLGFVDKFLESGNLYQNIDEGVFTGEYTKHGSLSELISDDNTNYIQINSTATEGLYNYKCFVDPAIISTYDSFLSIRAAAPLTNFGSQTAPRYNISNITLEDPDGNLIVKYKDFSFRGDADYVDRPSNYSTYITEPETNYGNLYQWQDNRPNLGFRHGFTLNLDIEVECLDDPFDTGFNKGYEEFVCETDFKLDADNDYLAIDGTPLSVQTQSSLNPTPNLRISALEVFNRGQITRHPHPLTFGDPPLSGVTILEDFVPLNTAVRNAGQKITKHIFPSRVMASDFDTTIYPPIASNVWKSNAYPDPEDAVTNETQLLSSGLFLANRLADRSLASSLELESTTVQDSGKLIVQFKDKRQKYTTFFKGRDYSIGDFGRSFNKSGSVSVPIDDTYYDGITDVFLVVYAKKDVGSRDYALDVVGYSDDEILFVSPPSGGFLQNIEGGTLVDPIVASSSILTPDDLGLSSETLSSKENEIRHFNNVANSGGDHFILTQTPIINSTAYKEYRIPLKIYDTVPELGPIQRFDYSRYFENLYLDIYPIPSGASIADMHIELQYSPQNALHLRTLGSFQEDEIALSHIPLHIDRPPLGEPAIIYKDFDRTNIPFGHDLTYDRAILNSDFVSPSMATVPDNLSKRWRGISGKQYYQPFDMSFDFSFSKDATNTPFDFGYFDFTHYDSNSVNESNGGDLVGSFVGSLTSNDIHKNLGWRFNSDTFFSSANNLHDYKSIRWDSNYETYDSFDSVVTVSGVNKHINFGNIDFTNGFSVFVRFAPHEWDTSVQFGDDPNALFLDSVVLSKYNAGNDLEFAIGFRNSILVACASDVNGNIHTLTSLPHTSISLSFPISVLLTYDPDDNKLRLYADNESEIYYKPAFNNPEWNVLLDESNTFEKVNTNQDVTLGWCSGSGIGANAFVTEVGFSDKVIQPSDYVSNNNTYAGAETLFSGMRKRPYRHQDELWEYVKYKSSKDWTLGEFRHCHFNQAFSRLSDRQDEDYVEHRLVHDGSPYSSKIDYDLPETLAHASGLAYHTQIENDFLRFEIENTPETSGKFHAVAPRIETNLPRGYNFAEEAIAVDTVIEFLTNDKIAWDNGDLGPKLIVSLYSPYTAPKYQGSDKSLGLINRQIHQIEPSGCIHKITSIFDKDNLLDNSEPWSTFNHSEEHIIKEFDHKYYSGDINDMFLQYDLVYPSGYAFDASLRLHAAKIRLRDALRSKASLTETFTLFASGELVSRDYLKLVMLDPHEVASDDLNLFNSGVAWTNLFDDMNLFASGGLWPEEQMNLFSESPHQSMSVGSSNFGSLFGSSDDINPLNFFVEGGFISENMSLFSYNDEVVIDPSGKLNLVTYSQRLVRKSLDSPFNLYVKAPTFPDSGVTPLATMNLVSFHDDKYDLSSSMNLFAHVPIVPPDSSTENLNLFTINYPAFDLSLTQQQVILWDGENTGTNILVTDNAYSSLAADDEIRGVVTTCFGDCNTTSLCTNVDVTTHNIDWNLDQCVNGGVLRAKSVYTNQDVGYDHNYYGIRKYTGLIPSYPYTVTVRGYTGSTDIIELPRMIETVEYGREPNDVDFSGIKMFTNDPQGLHAQYGKDIVVRGDLMAIGAPDYTLYEGSKTLDKSGAVFLYRRMLEPSGYSWLDQPDKSGWELESVLTLPSGYQRDYFTTTIENVQGVNAPVRKWNIGNYGRRLGHSVDIGIDEATGKEIVFAGGPEGKFDRTFDEILPAPLKICLFVITDEFTGFGHSKEIKAMIDYIQARNRYFLLWSSPAFHVDVDIIILEPNKNVIFADTTIWSQPYNNFHNYKINRKKRGDGQAESDVIKNQIIDIFNEIYPHNPSVNDSNIPSLVSVIVDDSASCGRGLVTPAIDDFLSYYQEYSYNSGLLDWQNNPISGAVLELPYERGDQEDWITFANDNINYALSNDAISENQQIFTSGFGFFFAEDDYRFNYTPPSGGRVYAFEQYTALSGRFYDQDTELWNITQTFGLDEAVYNTYSPRDSFGHSISVSKNLQNIAIGSPHKSDVGVTVFEKSSEPRIYDSVVGWLNTKASEEAELGNSLSVYYFLYQDYLAKIEEGFSQLGANKYIYDSLSPTYRFDLLTYVDAKTYTPTFDYKNNYNYQGTYGLYPQNFASRPRVGHSVSLNDDGTILAVGCPTDSMNMSDDTNVWYRNTKECDEETNAMGLKPAGGYQSPFDSEAHLQDTIKITSAGTSQGTWPSHVNAGAVQVFTGRRYYPHDKVVEFGIFGNAYEEYNDLETVASGRRSAEYNIVSGVFSSSNVEFIKTSFVDPEIPEDAGLLIINAPSKDSLSQEVLENLKSWLALGDRHLVIVGDDPVWEADGEYEETNRICNKILENLDSRMRLAPSRNQQYAQTNPDIQDTNVIRASIPQGSISSFLYNGNLLFASGVADIRLYDPNLNTHRHGCEQPIAEDSNFLTEEDRALIDGELRYTYDTANVGCSLPISHLGDLRAEWYEWCTDIRRNYHKVPRNVPVAYGVLPGLTDPLCDKGLPCDKAKDCNFTAKNQNVPPRAILTISENVPQIVTIIPGTEEETQTVVDFYRTIPSADPSKKTFTFGEPKYNIPAFNWDAVLNSGDRENPFYSGNFTNLDTNFSNSAEPGGEYFKPDDTDKAFLIQANDLTFSEEVPKSVLASNLTIIAGEESLSGLNSSVVLIANVTGESLESMQSSPNDNAIIFYRNLLTKYGQEFDSETLRGAELQDVHVAQLGGWTRKSNFQDGYDKSFIFIDNEDPEHFDGVSYRYPDLFDHVQSIDINVTPEELLNGRTNKNYNYDICWIANTKYLPSEEDLDKLKRWLALGNKKLIITYAHDVELESEDRFPHWLPSQIVAEQTEELCEMLGISMKPLYLSGVDGGKYAEFGKDSYYNPDAPRNSAGIRTDIPDELNAAHYTSFYSNTVNLKEFTFYANNNVPQIIGNRDSKYTAFIPIDLQGGTRIASMKQRLRRRPNDDSIRDLTRSTNFFTYNDSGYTKVSFPTEHYQDSGYYVELDWQTYANERNSTANIYIVNAVKDRNAKLPNGLPAPFPKVTISDKSFSPRESRQLVKSVGIYDRETLSSSTKTVKLGPFYATGPSIDLYISHEDMGLRSKNPNDSVGKTARLVHVSGFPVPIFERFGVDLEPVFKDIIIPATPDTELTVTPPKQEMASPHSRYCPSDDCLPLFDLPLNFRGGETSSDWRATYLSKNDIRTADGSVVVAQEIDIASSFSSGYERSRITLISDASLIQGKHLLEEDGSIKNGLNEFIYSLYRNFPGSRNPAGIDYTLRTKLQSPERGSPYKWYSASSGNYDLISRFNPNNNAITISPMSAFTDYESEYDPTYVHRPKFFWECDDFEAAEFDPSEAIKLMISNFKSGLHSNFSSAFSGVIEGKGYIDSNNNLYLEKGYDFLDFDHFSNGYPGDLFGYSVKLDGDTLFVGAPFSAFAQENKTIRWNEISQTALYEMPSGVKLSGFGGAGSVYMFEKSGKGNSPIRQQQRDWEYIRKFRPDSINVGQDYDFSTIDDTPNPEQLGSNNYSVQYIIQNSVYTDRFGASLDSDAGVLVIGAPGHDFANVAHMSAGDYQNKAFGKDFNIRERSVYDLGSSGIRFEYPNSGLAIFNNGAAYVYSKDYDFGLQDYYWRQVEKIVPQGNNAQKQYLDGVFPDPAVSGAENSNFGNSVSVERRNRVDSDYTIAVGSKNHPFDNTLPNPPVEACYYNAGSGPFSKFDFGSVILECPTTGATKSSILQGANTGFNMFSNAQSYTNNTGNLVVFDGLQSGTFNVGDLVRFSSSIIWSNLINPNAIYEVKSIITNSSMESATVLNNPPSQILEIGCPEEVTTEYHEYKGASYTYDLMLRRQVPALADSGASIHARLYSYSGVREQEDTEILLNIINSGEDRVPFLGTGIVYTNNRGELFLEASGQDFSDYGFIQHRPFIESVNGKILAGPTLTNALRFNTEGRPDEASGSMPLFSQVENTAFVYNNVGLYTFGITDIASDRDLTLYNQSEVPHPTSGIMRLFASGIGTATEDDLRLQVRGF